MLLRIYVRHKAFFTNINILTYGKVKMHCIPLVEKCDTLKPLYSSVQRQTLGMFSSNQHLAILRNSPFTYVGYIGKQYSHGKFIVHKYV